MQEKPAVEWIWLSILSLLRVLSSSTVQDYFQEKHRVPRYIRSMSGEYFLSLIALREKTRNILCEIIVTGVEFTLCGSEDL